MKTRKFTFPSTEDGVLMPWDTMGKKLKSILNLSV